mmetsp:Transcript_5744/g.8544  ORF Transcript_5744/g.8544 Transcript_5744/m.8544 type:complete len:116 (+) Transcript_5744:220-567(+)
MFVVILPFLCVFLSVKNKLRTVKNELSEVCSQKSGGGIVYSLIDEHWGGCSKPHVRRFSFAVKFDEEAAPVMAATESFVGNPRTRADESWSTPAYTETKTSEGGQGTTSIFDSLK